MRVSYQWLSEFARTGLSAVDAAEKLTMAGLEVEAVEQAGDDYVFEVNVTPNRPDCLSHLGIARELAAITGAPLTLPAHELAAELEEEFTVETLDTGLCARYAGRIVRGITLGESPDWMKERLEKCGIRAINNIVDITNYVLLELGHPLHAFDLATLRGATIRVGGAGKGQRITTLDGAERELPEEALLIWDAERPVAVAGVMGGAETEVSDRTTDIFIESAWFLPGSVRRTSKSLGLSTEASYRFERGTDIEGLIAALDRATRLVVEVAGGRASGLLDTYPLPFRPRRVSCAFEKVNRVLGTELSPEDVTAIMGRLGMEAKDVTADGFSVDPPPYRPDIEQDVDLIEEVARLYGFARIPTKAPRTEMTAGRSSLHGVLGGIKEVLRKDGYHDAVNYSFMNVAHLDILGIPEGDRRRMAVPVMNPLRSEDAHLRTTLVPSLVGNYLHNAAHGVRGVRLFELARVFVNEGGDLPVETLHLGGLYSPDTGPSLYPERTEPFYAAKGTVESLLDRLGVKDVSYSPSKEPYLHPGKAADVASGGEHVGHVGVLSPAVIERLGGKAGGDVVVFEFDLERLLPKRQVRPAYHPLPRYPAVERDVALLLDEAVPAAEVIGHVRSFGSAFIEDVSVFDSYRGKNIPRGKRSLAVSIRYRSPERTLTDEEVEETHRGLVEHLVGKTGGEVRGA